MTQSDRDRLLHVVRDDIATHQGGIAADEAEIAVRRQRILEARAQIEELTRIERFLMHGAPPAGSQQPQPIAPAATPLPAASTPHSSPDPAPEQIREGAERILRAAGPGHTMKALEVTRQLFPGYDPFADDRKLENRVFTTMRRAPETFVRVARGMWTLVEFQDGESRVEDDEANEEEYFPGLGVESGA